MTGAPGDIWEILPEESSLTSDGELQIGGVSLTALAERYGTPLHVIDEVGLRRQIRRFLDGLESRRPGSAVIFASKSFPVVEMYRIAEEEGLAVDVAGGGELMLAVAAGVSPERIYFHGNAKTQDELAYALRVGVGTIIIDNTDELDRLDAMLVTPQRLLLRVIPEIDARTHSSQATGGKESKFGLPIDQAYDAILRMQAHPLMQFAGVHLHIGSQILDTEQFAEAVARLSGVGAFDVYDVGGGLGVNYTYKDGAPSVDAYLEAITRAAEYALPDQAQLMIEPGRSLVARAGVTLYEVVAVKKTGRSFLAVDGGMADQLDVALTGQRYEAVPVRGMTSEWTENYTVVGRQCESGDLLIDGALLPEQKPSDLVAMLATGAYSYTTSNNYNGALKPAIVFVSKGQSKLVARRETYADLLALHEPALTRRYE